MVQRSCKGRRVIADKNNRVVALGYNGFPVGIEDSADRYGGKDKLNMVVHAEENAILIAGRSAEGGTIYVHGKPVCSRCAGLIIQAGIKRVVASVPNDPKSKWYKTGQIAIQMIEEAGLEFIEDTTIFVEPVAA